jgi:hypothetical protein
VHKLTEWLKAKSVSLWAFLNAHKFIPPKRQPEKKHETWVMLGEFLREIAALILVFAFLEPLSRGGNISGEWAFWSVALAGACLLIGIALERR